MLSLFRRTPPDVRTPIIRRVSDLEILSARLIRAGFAGDYHSAFHGRGIEFSQVREYQPGDDIRTIDWNVTARSGTPHVKQFIEERDLTILIAIDVSGSMAFGSVDWRKCDIAAELTSVFAFSAVENADREGQSPRPLHGAHHGNQLGSARTNSSIASVRSRPRRSRRRQSLRDARARRTAR